MLPSAASLQNSFAISPTSGKHRRGARDGPAREQPPLQATGSVASANGVQNAFALAPTDSLPVVRSKGGRPSSPALVEGVSNNLIVCLRKHYRTPPCFDSYP